MTRLQRIAAAFGLLMLAVIVLITPWTETVQGTAALSIGAWAPLWAPPSPTASVDWWRLSVEAALVFVVTGVCVWMLKD